VIGEILNQLLTTVARVAWSLFASRWFYVVAALAVMGAYAELR
jgi:hypothetical protein